jgi:hypothetical protein
VCRKIEHAPESRPERIKAAAARPLETLIVFLFLIDPRKNITRLYIMAVMPRLFGECSLRREQGHIGSPGTVRSRKLRYERAPRAEQRFIRRRERRSYKRQTHLWHFPVSSATILVMVVLTSPRAADDFQTIRKRMEELRRERAEVLRGEPIASPQPSSPSRAAADPGFVDASID